MTELPRLETPRLVLRGLDPHGDLDDYAAMLADEETTRHIGGPVDRGGAWRSLALMIGHWQIQGFGMFAVVERETDTFVGRVGPWYPGVWPGLEIGWAIARSRWGRGYAVEAAAATIDFALDALGWDGFIHVIGPQNQSSKRVAEKLGSKLFRFEESLPVFGERAEIWGQSADEWRARCARP